VLAAIVLPELLVRDGAVVASFGNYRLVAGIIAVIVAWRFRRAVPTIAVGMLVLWLLQYFNG
jgi:branched-subunit amino acid transport protein